MLSQRQGEKMIPAVTVDNLTIEGCDLSGKSTLYWDIHKSNDYAFNIHDRAQLTMLVYARRYNRDKQIIKRWRRQLKEHLFNLDNRLIVLMPTFSLLRKRYEDRGDPIHDLDSLWKVYSLYKEEIKHFESFPNVLIISGDDVLNASEIALLWLNNVPTIKTIHNDVRRMAQAQPNNEASGLSLTLSSPTPFPPDDAVFDWDLEREHYTDILNRVRGNITDELSGNNKYSTIQEQDKTRRFVFVQPECISMIHTIMREDTLTMRVTARSTDVIKFFPNDIRFLGHLFSKVTDLLDVNSIERYELKLTMNSAHILS
jgi:hypothetical protein